MADEDRQDKDTIPSGVACAGCGYDLAGLPRGGVCPECGLDVPASWPVWDLRQCAKPYVEHVHDEMRMLHWATLTAWMVLSTAAISGIDAAVGWRGGNAVVIAMVFGLVSILGLVPLSLFVAYAWSSLGRHPNGGRSPGAAERRRLRWSAGIGATGLVMAIAFIATAFATGDHLGQAYVATTTALSLGGLGWASVEAMGYAQLTLRRAGARTGRHGLLLGWGFALIVLAIVTTGWIFVDLGRPLLLAAASGALLGPATALAVRVARAMAVVDVMAADKPASNTP